jgi:hypothetical protein
MAIEDNIDEKEIGTADIEDTRISLLKNYHSNIQTHAGYMIALIVGGLTIFSRLDIFFGKQLFVPHAGWIFIFLIGILITSGIWIVLRIIYWTSYVNLLYPSNTKAAQK